jgi:hypothetical protein
MTTGALPMPRGSQLIRYLVVGVCNTVLSYARFSELSSNHRTDLNVGGHQNGCPQ